MAGADNRGSRGRPASRDRHASRGRRASHDRHSIRDHRASHGHHRHATAAPRRSCSLSSRQPQGRLRRRYGESSSSFPFRPGIGREGKYAFPPHWLLNALVSHRTGSGGAVSGDCADTAASCSAVWARFNRMAARRMTLPMGRSRSPNRSFPSSVEYHCAAASAAARACISLIIPCYSLFRTDHIDGDFSQAFVKQA